MAKIICDFCKADEQVIIYTYKTGILDVAIMDELRFCKKCYNAIFTMEARS